MELSIKLDSYDFSERTPTKTQLENMASDMSSFLQQVTGSLLATKEYVIKDPFMQHLFNAASALGAVKETLGQNASGLEVPRVGAVPMPGPPRR